jgi:hypothetical protein
MDWSSTTRVPSALASHVCSPTARANAARLTAREVVQGLEACDEGGKAGVKRGGGQKGAGQLRVHSASG